MSGHDGQTISRAIFGGAIGAVVLSAWVGNALAANVFINELHYDNDGSDVDEFVEIAGPAGTDLTGWQIILYNGASGAPYRSVDLDGNFGDQSNGLGTRAIAVGSLQNGAPDGLALVDSAGVTVELLSYEGVFTATSGAAAGLVSLDLGVGEPGTDTPGLSLQRIGTGRSSGDFVWSGPDLSSAGSLNAGQIVVPAPVPLPAAIWSLLSALLAVAVGKRALGSVSAHIDRSLGAGLRRLCVRPIITANQRPIAEPQGCLPNERLIAG